MNPKLLLLAGFLILALPLAAQEASCPCLEDDCGDILSDFVIEGGEAIVCDGYEFTVTNTTTATNVEQFIWNWGDGTADVTTTNENVSHIYSIPDSLVCDDDKTNYVICLTIVRECAEGISCHSTSKPVGVIHRPLAGFALPDAACEGEPVELTNLTCNASEFLWEFGNGETSTDENPEIIFDEPGNYPITLTATNGCESSTFSAILQVVGIPDNDFSIDLDPASACEPVTLSLNGQNNGWGQTQWYILPNDTTLWSFVDTTQNLASEDIVVIFHEPGTYDIGLSSTNGCGEAVTDTTITVLESPQLNLVSPGLFCDEVTLNQADVQFEVTGDLDAIQWTFTGGTPATASGPTFSGVTFTESGTIAVTVTGPCGNETLSVPVTVVTTEAVSVAGNPAALCQDVGEVQLQATPPGGQWSGAPVGGLTTGGELNPANLTPGVYTLTYSAGAPECPNEASFELEIRPPVSVSLAAVSPACESLSYTPQVSYSGEIESYSWTFTGGTPATANVANPGPIEFSGAGTYQVVINVGGDCGMPTDTLEIEIQSATSLSIAPVDQPLCSGSSPDTLAVNVGGGQWIGDGIIDEVLGIFDPGSVTPDQTYTVTYEFVNGACTDLATIDLEVVASQVVTAQDELLCEDSPALNLTTDAPGGSWSGPGITDSNLGTFNPAASGTGTFSPRYDFTDPNGCEVSTMAEVIVEAFPVLDHLDTVDLCLADAAVDLPEAFSYSPNPGGGQTTWSGPGVQNAGGTFNSGAAGLAEGVYTVYIDYERNACSIRDSVYLSLVQPEPLALTPDTAVCISDANLSLAANLAGGDWSGPGIDEDSGEIDLNLAGGGPRTYTYLYQAGTTCEQEEEVLVDIIDLSQVVQAGPDIAICERPGTYTLTGGAPAAGAWVGEALLDEQAGLIDLSQITLDSVYTYQYCVESQQVQGCSACASRTFIVNANPEAEFGIDGLPCIGETFSLVNASVNAAAYAWDFGDNSGGSSQPEPTYTYTTQGTYDLTLIATSAENCRDTLVRELYITTPPTAAFDLALDEGCAPFLLEPTNNSFGDSISHTWYIAGDTLVGVLPGAVYLDSITTDSIFQVILAVDNFCGEVRDTSEVLVHPYPLVDFGLSIDEGCSPVAVDFANGTLGDPDSYAWDLGNGVTSTDSIPPSQVYTTVNGMMTVYTVTLSASNECGQDTLSQDITVFPPDVDAFIAIDTLQGCQPMTLQPESFSTPGANVSWIITDEQGNTYGSNQVNPTFELLEPGLHTIILVAANCGSDRDTAYVNVEPAPPVSFTHRPFICVGEPVTFTNTSSQISENEWDFGEGTFSQETSPTHVFDSVGTFTVSLTGYSLVNDCPATFTSEIIVVGNPTAAFTPSELNGCSPLTVDFTNESTGNGELSYVWNFSDGSSNSFETDPVHTFVEPGNYPVRLITYDQDSCFSDTTVLNIFVYDHPVSDFELASETYCHRYDSVQLQNTSLEAVSYEWLLPDTTLTAESPSWLPDLPGDYTVSLVAENIFGCRDTSSQELTVLESPIADYDISAVEGCEDLLVEFDNESTYGTSNFWTFGDGATSTDQDPVHLYLEPGTLTATLTVSHTNGCPSDELSTDILVHPTPVADFTYQKPEICGAPITVIFTNTSTGSLDNNWTFGNGDGSDQTSPIYTYTEIGAYSVNLLATNQFGCADSTTEVVDIYGNPLANFALSPAEGCEDLLVDFTNSSLEALTYEWLIDGFPVLDSVAPQLLFTEPGVYDVTLVAVYNDLCQDTLDMPGAITVYDSPIADFTYAADESDAIIGDVRFENLSIDSDRFLWDLGDGTLTDEVNPEHEYDINRSVEVLLTAFNDNDGQFTCVDTLRMPVDPEWITTFYAPNAFAPEYGEGKVRVFQPVGVGITAYEISVFSPWGELLWHSTELENFQPVGFWDGRHKGELVPQGAYVWLAKLTFADGAKRIEEGTVTVLR